jgi:hypothetical protein
LAGEVQFCQQCGLALEGVRELVEDVAVEKRAGGRAPRREGYRRGFMLAVAALLILPFYPLVENLLGALIPSVENSRLDELPLGLFTVALFVLFAAGVARMLYARLFESAEASGAPAREKEARLSGQTEGHALPPSQSIPAEEFFAGRPDPADLAEPRSVTEHTTRSLRID